jgi:hypothetical protein
LAAWLKIALAADDGTRRMVVVAEVLPPGRGRLDAGELQLSLALGTMNVLVMHRLSDLASADGAGWLHVRLAEGLLADTETRVISGQPASEVDRAS